MTATTLQRRRSGVLRAARKVFGVGLLALLVVSVTALVRIRSDYYASQSVELAARYAQQVMLAIEEHHSRHGMFPAGLSELTLPAGDAGFVPKLAFDASTGALSVAVETDHGSFGSLRYQPSRDSSGGVRWRCVNVSVPTSLLPDRCERIDESAGR